MYQDSLTLPAEQAEATFEREPAKAFTRSAVGRDHGVDSEYGRLRSVLLADPSALSIVPCNSVSVEAIRSGQECRPDRAGRQHRALAAALEAEEVRVERLSCRPDLPDLAFTRDSSLMTPWGLVGLRPGASHRKAEVDWALQSGRMSGHPVHGRVTRGRVEGGDVAMIRPGRLLIGISNNRTDGEGAKALAQIYERQGWQVLRYHFDPHFLHLDTIFCMVDSQLALACTDVLDDGFIDRIEGLGIELIRIPYKEARKLGCNLLSLGDRRVITSGTSPGADLELARRNYRVIRVELGEFLQCGGGVHCLTMPLDRAPA